MSKVSDALRRASEENGEKIAGVIDEREQMSSDVTNDNAHADEDGYPIAAEYTASNGHDSHADSGIGHTVPVLPEFSSLPKRGFKDVIEKLLFGWDLGRYDAYPLVALGTVGSGGEQFKILRDQINKICSELGHRTIMVTSAVKQDGKTTVAANLAAAMALDFERQVLLIDADLRRPSVHRYFGIRSSPGLSEYLNSNNGVDLVSYVQNTALPGLRILPAGKPSPVSAELFATERMRSLIKELPELFPGHQIIIDSSPILSTSDPLVLSRLTDGVVMVVRAGKTPRSCLSAAFKSLASNKIIGIVLNGAELGMESRYYQYAPVS